MNKDIIELDDASFDSKIKKGKWVVDFWASWCGPCKVLSPIVDEAAVDLKGKVNFGKVNVDENQDLAGKFEIMSIPTVLFIKDGEVVNRFVGVREKEDIVDMAEESF